MLAQVERPALNYGRDHADLGLWVDVDGVIYDGRGPFERRPLRIVRRRLAHWRVVVRRWWSR